MNVSLTPQLEALVKAKVETGLYNSASEVVREALRLLDEQDRLHQVKLDELRQAIRRGYESGSPREFDPEAFLARMNAQHRAQASGTDSPARDG
ncbi:MAG: type II toxin-antitoxin system ParD family antitoxin [Bacteroidota bacterium]